MHEWWEDYDPAVDDAHQDPDRDDDEHDLWDPLRRRPSEDVYDVPDDDAVPPPFGVG